MRQKTPRRVLRLRRVRREREMTQAELGRLVGLDKSTISEIEAGNLRPSLEKARELAKVFGEPIEALFFEHVEVPR